MNTEEKQLKQEIIDGLASRDKDLQVMKDIFENQDIPTLGQDFTDKVMDRIKTRKQPSPIIKISRIALPLTACAAAIVICVALGTGMKSYPGFDTVRADSDNSFQQMDEESKYIYGSGENLKDDVLYDEAAPEDGLNADVTVDSEECMEAEEMPEISAPQAPIQTQPATSKGSANGGDEEESTIYSMSNSIAFSSVDTFVAAENEAEDCQGEIVLLMTEGYAEYSLFGVEYRENDTDKEYELIRVNSTVDKETFLSDIEEYLLCLTSEMSNALSDKSWTIEIISVSALPDALTPEMQIKIIKEQNTEE